MTAGDIESVFPGHTRRRLRPHTVGGAWTDADQILLCTDGFARLVSDYPLYPDWRPGTPDPAGTVWRLVGQPGRRMLHELGGDVHDPGGDWRHPHHDHAL